MKSSELCILPFIKEKYLKQSNIPPSQGIHWLVNEGSEWEGDVSREACREARAKLHSLPNPLFEELAQDVYDEVMVTACREGSYSKCNIRVLV